MERVLRKESLFLDCNGHPFTFSCERELPDNAVPNHLKGNGVKQSTHSFLQNVSQLGSLLL